MELSEEEQLNKNALMFIYMRENKQEQEKLVNIANIIKDGANVNACDRNYNYNTVLHIAAQRAEKDIVQLLLDNGALIFYNNDAKTPIDIAKENESAVSKQIVDLLDQKGKHAVRADDPSLQKSQEAPKNRQNNGKGNTHKKVLQYLKRAGTSGVSGQFYETKLLSLVLLRALDNTDIEHFLLATNIKDIGDFDDVCFRYKLKHHNKAITIFLQAKHRDDPQKGKLTVANVKNPTGDFSMAKYFDSFLKIRQKFSPDNPDSMFKGDFSAVECYFILYTPLKDSFNQKCEKQPLCEKVHNIIYTGEKNGVIQDTFQFNYGHNDIDFLTQFILEERVKNLGLIFLDFIMSSKERHDSMMTNNLIKMFHSALAREVLSVSEVKPENYRIGHFRQDFFDSDDDILILLKETLCKGIVANYCKKTTLDREEILKRIEEILNRPCSQTISHLIGDVITFDDKNIRLILNESYIPSNTLQKEDTIQIKNDLLKIVVTPAVIKDAFVLAGKPKLESLKLPATATKGFKLPATFGNSDLSIRGKENKILSRINFLATKFVALINKYKVTKIIDISNETVGPGKILEYENLETNGGIGGAVGNLLEYDKGSGMLVFNTVEHTLPDKAKKLFNSIKSQTTEDLTAYKIEINIEVFPKLLFNASQYDKNLAKDFLNKLWFYTGQAKEDEVERILKNEIDYHCNADKNHDQLLFRVQSDAIFLRFHDEIQKWWKSPVKAQYLTKNDKLFDKSKKDIIDSPLLTVLNIMCIRQIKKTGIEFKPISVEAFDLDNLTQGFYNVISEAVVLSASKIMQYSKYQSSYIYINLDYVLQLPLKDYNTMIDELSDTKASTLIIINELPIESPELREKLNKIFTNFIGKKIIIIAEKELNVESDKWNSNPNKSFYDECINLTYLTLESQSKILNKFKIIYQGNEVTLGTIIDKTSKHLVDGKLLRALLNNGKVEIGHNLHNPKYDQMKHSYMKRPLKYNGEAIHVNTFNDVSNNLVVISGKPCIGKTTLLSHLTLETKKDKPHLWIVRINLAYSKELEKLQNKSIGPGRIMKFLCQSALKDPDEIKKITVHETDSGQIYIECKKGVTVSFELKLFINYYNNNQTIFLFDGFDRIYAHNAKECVELFKRLQQHKKRLWITTSSYFSKALEREFGQPYELEVLSMPQQKSFLHSFWKTNLKLEKLNHDQYNNISLFFQFMSKTLNRELTPDEEDRSIVTLVSLPLHLIYVMAVEYFENEINISPRHIREQLKKKWRLDSHTSVDRFLRNAEDKHLELAGTPLHMYIAANYFQVQIKDKLHIDLNGKEIEKNYNVYLNAVTSYEMLLKGNIIEICKSENRRVPSIEKQDQFRDEFIEKGKKLALYAICKESDVNKILSTEEIREVQLLIKKTKENEEQTDIMDCNIDGASRLHNFLFTEYFAIEYLTNLLKATINDNNVDMIRLESIWDGIVNGLLMISPPSVRNAFEYKLKYDPELMEIASNTKSSKILFNLILKQQMKGNPDDYNANTTLGMAVNEGLVNISSLLLKCVTKHATGEDIDVITKVAKSGLLILSAAGPSWKEAADKAFDSLHEVKQIAESGNLNSEQIDSISQAVVTLCTNTDAGKVLNNVIQTHVAEPIKKITDKVVTLSGNNENLTTLVEQLPYHLPDIVKVFFGKINEVDSNQK